MRLLALVCLCGLSCAGGAEQRPPPVAAEAILDVTFLPPTVVMPRASAGHAALDAMFERVRSSDRLRLHATAPGTRVPPACSEDPACLRHVSERSGAQKIITAKIAQLGDHQIIRVALVDVARGASQKTWQEETAAATPSQLAAVMDRIGAEMIETLVPPPPTPWYRQPWVWVSAAGLVVAGVVTAALVTRDRDAGETESPPIIISPP